MRRFVRLGSIVFLVTVALGTGCGGGSGAPGGENAAPTLSIFAPAADLHLSQGDGLLPITYVDDDPDDVALTDLFADADGDLSTTGDQHAIGLARADGDGGWQEALWDKGAVPVGTYRIVGRTQDGTNPPVLAEAAGRVHVHDVGWVNWAGEGGDDVGSDVATFADGSCVVAGYFYALIMFGTGIDSTTLSARGSADMFIAKYDPDGTLAWVKQAGGTRYTYARGIASFADGSFVVSGMFNGTATFGEGTDAVDLFSTSVNDAFVARYRADGSLVWAKQSRTSGDAGALGITSYADGSCVLTGYVRGTTTFGEGAVAVNLTTQGTDVLVARYDASGALTWATRAGGPEWDSGNDVGGFSDGSCVVTGRFEATATFGTGAQAEDRTSRGGTDGFLARYDANGALVWVRQAGGTQHEWPFGVAALADGSCVATGYFQGTGTFGTGAGATDLTSHGDSDAFVARYDASGTLAWVRQAGGPGVDNGMSVAAYADGSCVVAGRFQGTAAFDSAGGVVLLTSDGSWDIFTARYGANGALAWAKRAGGAGEDASRGSATFADGSFVTTGYFDEAATFGEAPDSVTVQGWIDLEYYVVRYDADGTL